METEVKNPPVDEKKKNEVNFLRNDQKDFDWRYETYTKLRRKDQYGTKTIYWLGVIELNNIKEKEDMYPICYANRVWEIENDKYVSRHDDGAYAGVSTAMYSLRDIKDSLLEARSKGFDFFHIFIEETVNARGSHEVSLIYIEQSNGKDLFGVPSHKPWTKEAVDKWAEYSFIALPSEEKLRKIGIGGSNSYNWMK